MTDLLSKPPPSTNFLDRIRIVLIETSHPGNIGAAARAMKTMGLSRLFLVNPKHFPNAEATSRASGADDVLSRAVVCDSLDEALAGCVDVVGASARLRSLTWPQLNPRDCAVRMGSSAEQGDVALLFGRERSGLSNEELDRCRFLVHIPSNPDYQSLNIAAAVQVLCYELAVEANLGDGVVKPGQAGHVGDGEGEIASADDQDRLMEHMQQALIEVDFLNPDTPKHLMRRLRRLFNRAELRKEEVNILRGILSAAQRQARLAGTVEPNED